MIQDLLFELFGEGKFEGTDYGYWQYKHEDFYIYILEKDGSWLVSVDLKSCFNKTSQSPIHFIYHEYEKFSSRKKKRIHSALNFLLRSEKDGGTFIGSLPGYDDLDDHVRYEFYNN